MTSICWSISIPHSCAPNLSLPPTLRHRVASRFWNLSIDYRILQLLPLGASVLRKQDARGWEEHIQNIYPILGHPEGAATCLSKTISRRCSCSNLILSIYGRYRGLDCFHGFLGPCHKAQQPRFFFDLFQWQSCWCSAIKSNPYLSLHQ